ncbi:MAG: endonuclease/exonuclease/phosphatase family protein [Bacteriovoracia bacterium]
MHKARTVCIFSTISTLCGVLLAANAQAWEPKGEPIPVASNEIKIAAYNMLNLFDAQHDQGKEDYSFLPLGTPGKAEYCAQMSEGYYKKQCMETDWTEAKFQLKLRQIKKVLTAQGPLPDALAIEEIENENVAKNLAQVLGYDRYLITNSPDERGIDVALLYNQDKLTYIDHEEIQFSGSEFETKPTRNILRVHFRLPGKANEGKVFAIYANHWPSQAAGPTKRVASAQYLKDAIDKYTQKFGKDKYLVFVMGDFNTLPNEKPNAFDDLIQSAKWENALVDVQNLSMTRGNPNRDFMPPFSYFYRSGGWQKLDRFVVSKNLIDAKRGPSVMLDTFQIFVARFMCKQDAKAGYIPMDYNFSTTKEAELGFSDHLPIVVKLKI